MIRMFLYVISFLTLVSCVPQSDFDQLKSENEELVQKVNRLEEELSDIQYKYKQLVEENRNIEIERNEKPFITEEQALNYIKDNYEFYERDKRYKNVKLRRINDNSFKVSLDQCGCLPISGCWEDPGFCWRSIVRTLIVHNNGTYDFESSLH